MDFVKFQIFIFEEKFFQKKNIFATGGGTGGTGGGGTGGGQKVKTCFSCKKCN